MEFKFRGFDNFDTQMKHNQVYRTPSSSSSSSHTCFSDQAIKEGLWSGRSVGRGQGGVEILRGSVDMREAIQRELKERIREEIMAEEIARKRVLEAEVRRELMMEREMMAMQSGWGFPSSFMLGPLPSHNNRFEPGIPHGQPFAPVDRRIAMLFQEEYGGSGRHRREIGGFEVVPFQRLPRSPKVKEITTSLPEDGKEVIGLGKPNGATLSGAKRKPPASPAAVGSSKLCSYNSKKKTREEWSCAVCEISATCEHNFNEHISGKKHRAKVAALKAHNTGADLGLGVTPKKPTTLPALKSEKKLVKKQPSVIKNSSKCVSIDSKKEDGKTEGERMRQKFMFWCEMCHVGASSEKVMNKHKGGKKHLKNLLKLHQESGGQAAAGAKKARDFKKNPKAETMVISDKVIGAEDKESN